MSEQHQPRPGQIDVSGMARMYELRAQHEKLHAEGKRLPKETHEELHALIALAGGSQLQGRIPLNDAERDAVDKLIAKNPDAAMSLTRRDPGETGPLLVHVDDATYEIADSGKRKKVS